MKENDILKILGLNQKTEEELKNRYYEIIQKQKRRIEKKAQKEQNKVYCENCGMEGQKKKFHLVKIKPIKNNSFWDYNRYNRYLCPSCYSLNKEV